MVTSLLITNGTIATIDPRQPEAEAVGIIGDRIVAVGNRAMVEARPPRGYQTLDLAGPGVTEKIAGHEDPGKWGFTDLDAMWSG